MGCCSASKQGRVKQVFWRTERWHVLVDARVQPPCRAAYNADGGRPVWEFNEVMLEGGDVRIEESSAISHHDTLCFRFAEHTIPEPGQIVNTLPPRGLIDVLIDDGEVLEVVIKDFGALHR